MKLNANQQGATLIEVAVTVLILATSLLAMATLQTNSLRFNQSAFMVSQANIHVYDIMDRMRLNRGNDGDNRLSAYNVDWEGEPGGNAVATTDVAEWRERLKKDLPEGEGRIECVQVTRICTISIRWDEPLLFDKDDEDGVVEFGFTSVI